MATSDFQGLARLDALQRRPFGQNSRLRDNGAAGASGSGVSQYRKKAEDYNTAMRVLRREARRGDARSALGAIRLREEANADGFSPGGIRRKDEFDASAMGRVRTMEQGAIDREAAADMSRQQVTEAPLGDAAMPDTKTGAALDILEGQSGELGSGDPSMVQRGIDSASRLGVADPTSVLRGDQNLTYRRTLDTGIKNATSPEEIASLKERGSRFGVTPEAFDKRAKWWERNRKI